MTSQGRALSIPTRGFGLLVLLMIGLITLVPAKGAQAQLDPVSMVVGDFLKDRLIDFYQLEHLRSMLPWDGQKAVDSGFALAKLDVDKHYRKKQKKLCDKYEKKLEGRDVIHPDASTQKIIDAYNKEMDALLEKWAKEEKKLEQQRKECIEFFSKHWDENLKNVKMRQF